MKNPIRKLLYLICFPFQRSAIAARKRTVLINGIELPTRNLHSIYLLANPNDANSNYYVLGAGYLANRRVIVVLKSNTVRTHFAWYPWFGLADLRYEQHRDQHAATLSRRCAGHRLQSSRLNLKFAHLVFLNLAGQRGRKFRHKAHVLGNLVIRDLSLAEVLISSSVDSTPGRRRIHATTISPSRALGIPNTCTSPTLGCV